MRVLYVASFSDPTFIGGAEKTLKTLVEGMSARGHAVRVVSLEPSEPPHSVPDHTRLSPVRNLFAPDGTSTPGPLAKALWHGIDLWNPVAARDLAGQIAAFRPDVVSCHTLAGWSFSVWGAARRAGVPVVQVLHDYYLMCLAGGRSRRGRPCEGRCGACRIARLPHRRASRSLGGVVAISDHILRVFREDGYFDGVPIRRIYNAEAPMTVDLDRVRRPGPPVFGFLGTLAPHKGVEDLLRAFEAATLPDGTTLRIAGAGAADYAAKLAASAPPGVQFLGRQRPAEFLSALDWTIVPSLSDEPLGRVVFESLGAGVPVIASRRGGIPEILASPDTGVLVPAGDVPALARAMERAAGDLCRDRHAIARAAAPFFDVAGFLEAYEAVYSDTIRRRQAVRP